MKQIAIEQKKESGRDEDNDELEAIISIRDDELFSIERKRKRPEVRANHQNRDGPPSEVVYWKKSQSVYKIAETFSIYAQSAQLGDPQSQFHSTISPLEIYIPKGLSRPCLYGEPYDKFRGYFFFCQRGHHLLF